MTTGIRKMTRSGLDKLPMSCFWCDAGQSGIKVSLVGYGVLLPKLKYPPQYRFQSHRAMLRFRVQGLKVRSTIGSYHIRVQVSSESFDRKSLSTKIHEPKA